MTEPTAPDATDSGLDPRVAATLSYVVWWLTGLLFLFIERRNAFVRFHATQSLVGLGTLWLAGVVTWVLAFATLLLNPTAFQVLLGIDILIWAAFLVGWVMCLFKAYKGERWKLPYFGEIAEKLLR
jgi:uncharacterized membrane protein